MTVVDVDLASSPELVRRLEAAWPPDAIERIDGYRSPALAELRPVDVCQLGPGGALAVVEDARGARGVLPLVIADAGVRVAVADSGLSARLVSALARADREGMDAGPVDGPPATGFGLVAMQRPESGPGVERALGADQTNTSVVVDESAIVKWRTAPAMGGGRSLLLRRHLREVGFGSMAPPLGALTWRAPSGDEVVLAEIDGYLPGARDGWDTAIAALSKVMQVADGDELDMARSLGRLAGELHAALAKPSSVIPFPLATAERDEIDAWQRAALERLDRAVAIVASDTPIVDWASAWLRHDIKRLGTVSAVKTQPIHGDLHVGQVVHWLDGSAIIDFDGAPSPAHRDQAGTRPAPEPVERDVAQLLCSLELLAIVVDRRTDGRHRQRLRTWVRRASEAFLTAYRGGRDIAAGGVDLDRRLLVAFRAEQLCSELIYAAETLPRWRYAPIGVLRWHAPETNG